VKCSSTIRNDLHGDRPCSKFLTTEQSYGFTLPGRCHVLLRSTASINRFQFHYNVHIIGCSCRNLHCLVNLYTYHASLQFTNSCPFRGFLMWIATAKLKPVVIASSAQARLCQLNQTHPPAVFDKWYKEDQSNHSDELHINQEDEIWYVARAFLRLRTSSLTDISVICLDPIKEHDLIRALSCRHIYHTQCFDPWFSSSHDFCPMCHRLVLALADGSDMV
jgi:hypothetical protein